jgi:RimJ/RimL family protein N-acetyltransferase
LPEANGRNIRSRRRAEGLRFEREGTSRRDRCDLMLKA